MATTITCDKCGNIIEITEAIRKELEAKVLQETQSKHDAVIKSMQDENAKLVAKQALEIENVKQQITENAKKEALEKIQKDYDIRLKAANDEAEARENQNKTLQAQILDLIKQLRESKEIEGKLKIQFEQQLLNEQDKIRQGAKKEAQDEISLQMAQKDKMLEDMKKQLIEAQRKAEQGSQQLQGEVQEIALEENLRRAFVFDTISEVAKGVNGADIIQDVRTNSGISCGTIVWESKNTKSWSTQWISKLKEDSRTLKADIPVIVSAVLPDGIEAFGQIEGVWVCDVKTAIPLALALRERIIAVRNMKEMTKGKSSKAEIVYEYLISNDFRQRIEVWIEYFKARKEELDAEKRYFMKKWDKEDKNIMKVLQNTAGMYGDLQGLIGTALPKVQYLELPETTD